MRSLFRRIKLNGVAMSTLRILGTALVLAFGSQPIQSARSAESAVVTPLMLKELADIPGKEMLMITVDYPPARRTPSIVTMHTHSSTSCKVRLSCRCGAARRSPSCQGRLSMKDPTMCTRSVAMRVRRSQRSSS